MDVLEHGENCGIQTCGTIEISTQLHPCLCPRIQFQVDFDEIINIQASWKLFAVDFLLKFGSEREFKMNEKCADCEDRGLPNNTLPGIKNTMFTLPKLAKLANIHRPGHNSFKTLYLLI